MVDVARALILSTLVAANAGAQKLMLELRPHADDTLRMELQQVTEMSGGAIGSSAAVVKTTLKMFSRAIVESVAPIASRILAVTDSVDVHSSDAQAHALAMQAKQELEGRQMRLKLWPDGTVTLNDGPASVPREVNDLVSVMPASFPSKPVAVGETWTREMPVPTGESIGIPEGSTMRARFRLDSISADSGLAYVSMKGTLETAAKSASGDVGGTVDGRIVVNRKRGWLSESHFLLMLRSKIARKRAKDGDDMRFSVKVTQDMKTLKARTKR